MKFEKLKEIKKRGQKFCNYVWRSLFGEILSSLILIVWSFTTSKLLLLAILLLTTLFFTLLCIIFGIKAIKYEELAEDYIIIRVMDIIVESGIATENFDIINECGYLYKVGFHNQDVDYEELQSKIDTALCEMNKIAEMTIRVELI